MGRDRQRTSLPIVEAAARVPRQRSTVRAVALHLGRLTIIAVIFWLIHDQTRELVSRQGQHGAASINVTLLRSFYPTVVTSSASTAKNGTLEVLDAEAKSLGFVVQTSPTSDQIVGYAGPTNTLIAFDDSGRVVGMEILSSRDTPEHVAQIRQDSKFMAALVGRSWEDAAATNKIDAVSGATLTSLAILEGIGFRLAGTKPSLRFPQDIELQEIKTLFPQAARLSPLASSTLLRDVFAADGARLGSVLRTSPAADHVMGYQGPTDTLIAVDTEQRVQGIQLRRSYDNEPYVQYVREDRYFKRLFNDRSLQELANLDIREARIEGVSGATMTSLAVASSLPLAAQAALKPVPSSPRRIVVARRDVGTLLVLGGAMIISLTRLRGNRWARWTWQGILIGYFGFLNGDLLSQALFVGWAQSGVPWRLAPGLALLTAMALLVPAISRKQLYCHHICPFGAAQQLVRHRLARNVNLPTWCTRIIKLVSPSLLLLVVVTTMSHLPINLAGIEPFDAFLVFQVVGVASCLVAIAGLVAAACVPMAYCRYGCPTGTLLNYLRFHAHSDRLTSRDGFAVGLVLMAGAIRFIT